MSATQPTNSARLYLEIGQTSLKALDGDEGLELTLERQENGRLTNLCRERVIQGLQGFLKRKSWQPRSRAFCAINARGVSLRRLTLPAAPKEELQRLLLLQIEAEFPLPPAGLAWGWKPVNAQTSMHNSPAPRQELIVAALKKEVLAEYSEILSACGVSPIFTLAALTRISLCPLPPASYAVLDIGRSQSELLCIENGTPSSIRVLSWGGENITQSIADSLRIGHDEAESVKIKQHQPPTSSGELGQSVQNSLEKALDSLAALLKNNKLGQKVYLTGRSSNDKLVASQLSKSLGLDCERLEIPTSPGRSAAIIATKRFNEQAFGPPPLVIHLNETNGTERITRPAPWNWAAIAALLAFGVLAFPYTEALSLKSRLAKRLTAVKADKGRLLTIDRELNFLQYIKQNQSPYLDTVYLIAKAAAPGMRIDSLSMNRRGELALRGNFQNAQQITDFRAKLVESGLFANVSVEEQNPTPDRQKVAVRMSALWKPASARESLSFDPTPQEIEKLKNAAKEGKPGPPSGMNISGPLPPQMLLQMKEAKQ